MQGNYAVMITARECASLELGDGIGELGDDEIMGRSLASLVSPGTELNAYYLSDNGPSRPGYANVCRVERVGAKVEGLAIGDRVYLPGQHRSVVTGAASSCVKVPASLSAADAVITRLMQVSMTTLMTTTARPGDWVVVSGCGPVGYLAAQMFLLSGYRVVVVEPNAHRRELAAKSGVDAVFPGMPFAEPAINEQVGLVVECCGHEQAVLDALRIVRAKGEVVMVGVPWRKQTDLSAHQVLWEVFHKYPVLRSGWEWELPASGERFQAHSLRQNVETALAWLEQGRIQLGDTVSLHDPSDADTVYRGHLERTHKSLFTVFDWTNGQL